jgi:hypothetical protein
MASGAMLLRDFSKFILIRCPLPDNIASRISAGRESVLPTMEHFGIPDSEPV